MKTWTVALALLFACAQGMAQSAQTAPAVRRPCDDLKTEIAKKLDAKKLVGYSLDVVDKGKEGDAKVVGRCDGGTSLHASGDRRRRHAWIPDHVRNDVAADVKGRE